MLAELQLQSRLLLAQLQPELGEPGGLVVDGSARSPVERGSAPQRERLGEQGARLDGVAGLGQLPRLAHPGLDLVDVDPMLAEVEDVAGVGGDDQVVDAGRGAEGLAQRGDTDGDLVPRGGRWLLAPDGLDEGVHGDHSVQSDEEHRQHGALTATTKSDGLPVHPYVQRSEQPEVDPVQDALHFPRVPHPESPRHCGPCRVAESTKIHKAFTLHPHTG